MSAQAASSGTAYRTFAIYELTTQRVMVLPAGATPPEGARRLMTADGPDGQQAARQWRRLTRVQLGTLGERWIPVATNSGTFGATECHRAVGVGDPKFGTYTVERRVRDGLERTVGPVGQDDAPGYRRECPDGNATYAKCRAEYRRMAKLLSEDVICRTGG